MLKMEVNGSFKNLEAFLGRMAKGELYAFLEQYGQMGVDALASATPVDTGLTKESWTYKITRSKGRASISWHNTNVQNGIPVVILIQYGHGTGTGGWVEGRDFINPTTQLLFDKIANDVWEKVTRG